MKDKLKHMLPTVPLTLCPALLMLIFPVFWKGYLGAHSLSMILGVLLYSMVLTFVAMDRLSARHPNITPRRLVCLSAMLGVLCWVAGIGVYLLVAYVVGQGTHIRTIAFGVACAIYSFVLFVIAYVPQCIKWDKWQRILSLLLLALTLVPLIICAKLNPIAYFEGFRHVKTMSSPSPTPNFSAAKPFDASDYVVLQKDPSRDLVVLNLTDIQLTDYDFSPITPLADETFAYITELIAKEKPDLITVSGDIGCGYKKATLAIAAFLDSFKIPWAPVFGNHDHETHNLTPEDTAYIFENATYSLFRRGPADMGLGNYAIHVMEGNTLVHVFYMMDTHNKREYIIDGKQVKDYDHLWQVQLNWYEWAVSGATAYAGKIVPSTVIAHIPIMQYKTAFDASWNSDKSPSKVDDYKNGIYKNPDDFGIMWESHVYSSPVENGFYDVMVRLGSTKDYICGHDHFNNFSVSDGNMRLTYALKVGPGCYWNPKLNGGTIISIASDGESDVHHVYISAK